MNMDEHLIKGTGVFRKFRVSFSFSYEEVDYAIIEIDQSVIDSVDQSWKDVFFDADTPEKIAVHIAWNMFVNNHPLSQIEGFLDHPNSSVKINKYPSLDHFDMEAEEIVKEAKNE